MGGSSQASHTPHLLAFPPGAGFPSSFTQCVEGLGSGESSLSPRLLLQITLAQSPPPMLSIMPSSISSFFPSPPPRVGAQKCSRLASSASKGSEQMQYCNSTLGGPVKYGHGDLIRGERWLARCRCFMMLPLDKDDRSVHFPHQPCQTLTYAVVGEGEGREGKWKGFPGCGQNQAWHSRSRPGSEISQARHAGQILPSLLPGAGIHSAPQELPCTPCEKPPKPTSTSERAQHS